MRTWWKGGVGDLAVGVAVADVRRLAGLALLDDAIAALWRRWRHCSAFVDRDHERSAAIMWMALVMLA